MAHAETVLGLLKQRHGILLKPSFYDTWYRTQQASAQANVPEQLYQAILTHFLNTDIATSSLPSLQHNNIGQKTMTLQLQDTLDTSHSLGSLIDALDKNEWISRGYLKWIMTDGTQDIVVYELGKSTMLDLKTPFGSKIQITSCKYVNGLLLVKPECLKLLGGKLPVLYGDTMENELLRRYQRKLAEQGKTSNASKRQPGSTTQPVPTKPPAPRQPAPTNIPAYQIGPPSATTASNPIRTANSNSNNNIPIGRATSNSIPSNGTNGFDAEFDDFDDLTVDDLTDFDQLEQQAMGSFNKSRHHTTRPRLSLSTNPTKRPSQTRPTIIDLDDTPPSSPLQQQHIPPTLISDSDYTMTDDTLVEDTSVRKLISVSDLRKILRSVDDNSFNGDYDKVSVKVHGCRLKTMKPVSNQGLYLVAELLEEQHQSQRIVVSFIYYGINSVYEGYSLTEINQMKKDHGIAMVKEKIFKPLVTRFNSIEAELEIDLMLTENDESGLVRKGTKFTSLSSSG